MMLTLLLAASAVAAPPPAKVHVNGVDLQYVDQGRGAPIVFVHGGLMDYREWAPVAEELSSTYRTIAYSRRFNFPNDNPLTASDHSALVEAADIPAAPSLRLGRRLTSSLVRALSQRRRPAPDRIHPSVPRSVRRSGMAMISPETA